MGKRIAGWIALATTACVIAPSAARTNELTHGAAVLVLDPAGECALTFTGTSAALTINDGQLRVNSNAACAVCNNGNPVIDVSHMFVVGGSCFSGSFTGDLMEGAQPRPDPLANVPEPASTGPLRTVPNGSNITLQPGWYPTGIYKNNSTVNLQPGIYYLGGSSPSHTGGISIKGILTGHGVMIFLKSGGLDLSFSSVSMSPLNPVDYPSIFGSDTYAHMLVFQSRANASGGQFGGFTSSAVSGTVYFPGSTLTIAGGSGSIGSQLICQRLVVAGNGDCIVSYDGTHPGPLCEGDLDASFAVDVDDLLAIINAWGQCKIFPCEGDVITNGVVDIDDLLAVIAAWGACP